MNAIRILIVEDEILIAETIKIYLVERGHEVVGIAISYEEAIQLVNQTKPDLILLDIRLYGKKSGIDVANHLKTTNSGIPYIILSSQYDAVNIKKATTAGATGYLTKPIAKETLWSTVELASLKFEESVAKGEYMDLKISKEIQRIKIANIAYIKSDHVYVEIVCTSLKYVARYSLKEILEKIDHPDFVQCHRSFIVNIKHLQKINAQKVWILHTEIPIGAKYKAELLQRRELMS